MKKRILWVSEASFLSTGFAVLSHEILTYLHSTGKYEIAELGSYAKSSDPRSLYLPWKFYGGNPEPDNKLAISIYGQTPTAQFGEAVFEQVCLDFQPDIVIDVRDWWMCEFELRSPFRKYYKLIWMPTIDGEPQRLEWIDSYSRTDLILTYSKYGKKVLENEAPGRVKVFDVVSPGVNHNVFKPMDKANLREEFGIPQDINLVTTVMRNQRRKLYPDLIEAFRQFLQYCQQKDNDELARKTFLYLHTSYPDVGFDIPRHIMQNGIGHKVYVTYICERCKYYYSAFFHGESVICRRCHALAAHMPSTEIGLPREGIAQVINLADLYVQYSICEGFGMPIAEAKACGVPALGVDYSATAEQVNVEGCKPIRVEKFFYESVLDTEQKRALPDNNDAVEKIYNFLTLPEETKKNYSKLVRSDVEENHSFDRASRIFERAIDSVAINKRENTWLNPHPNFLQEKYEVDKSGTNAEFIDWCIDTIIKKPELKLSYWRNELVKALNIGFQVAKSSKTPFDRETAIASFGNLANINNFWEKNRVDKLVPHDEDRVRWRMI